MLVSEIIEATNGSLLQGDVNCRVTGFSQDTRLIKQGDLYIPIIGERFDGHDFIEKAFELGASAVISAKPIKVSSGVVILVSDTLLALQNMARYVRKTRNVQVVGVTGSVGKTSTKDMIDRVVSTKYKVLKTLGNFNNEIGLPLTILRHNDEDVLILEMGMSGLGEIALLSSIACPDVAVITNIGTAHIGELGGQDNIFKAKMEIVEHLNKAGCLVVNCDDPYLANVTSETFDIYKEGMNKSSFKIDSLILNEQSSSLKINGTLCNVPVPGAHFVLNSLIALRVGLCLGVPFNDCIKGIETFELTKGRNDIIHLNNDIICIDGTYNASEDSMKAMIDVVCKYNRRKVVVLGDMLELGKFSKEIHENIGVYIGGMPVECLFCYGEESLHIVNTAKSHGLVNSHHFFDIELLLKMLKVELRSGDVVMFKASNGMKLGSVIQALKEE